MFCAYDELQMEGVLMVFFGVRLSDAASLELNDFIYCVLVTSLDRKSRCAFSVRLGIRIKCLWHLT